MAKEFGIAQVVAYIKQMDLKISHVDTKREIIELAFHGDYGQWRMIVGFQQSGDVRKLMLIAPYVGTLTEKRRLECLEALMAVNYRIAIGKFGVDLDDGEVRLEEAIPISQHYLTFEQFHLAFSALLQTVAMYHGLLPRIMYGKLSVQDAIEECEEEFAQQKIEAEEAERTPTAPLSEVPRLEEGGELFEKQPELNVQDVLAEVNRIFEQHKE